MKKITTRRSCKNNTPADGCAPKKMLSPKAFMRITLAFCIIVIVLQLFASTGRDGSHLDSFSEKIITLSDGWMLTDSTGAAREIDLPLTIDYGCNGLYTLTKQLPKESNVILSPALCFYSNYIDVRIEMDGESLYLYPNSDESDTGATGNTYHYVRLPLDYAGKTLTIKLQCQLGDGITYLLKAPIIGSKATMLRNGVIESLPVILLAGCMLVLAVVLGLLYFVLKRRLELNSATAYTSLFAIIFAVYVFCETKLAQLIMANPYALFTCTLMLLALIPIPLVGLFSEEVSSKFKHIPMWLMLLASINFVCQTALHYAGISSYRVMLPATHAVIIVSIASMAVCMLLSDRKEKPTVLRRLLSALPMIAGGMADIILLSINRPSFNNSMWFTLGVTAFIAIQFGSFVRSFFVMYRTSLEADMLRDMAFTDALTGIGNRNAYEHKLKELATYTLNENICCFVIDINDLKQINDRYGHATGDAAIVETSNILKKLMPQSASCFRTGGDEFVVILENFEKKPFELLCFGVTEEVVRRGKKRSIPFSLAIGYGRYTEDDADILGFIRRIDAIMYTKKQEYKNDNNYPFKEK